MTPLRRWCVVALVAALLVGVPALWRARPVDASGMSKSELLSRVESSARVAFSGYVRTDGDLAIPVSEEFNVLGELLGATTRLRVWWRSADDWRVDQLRPTGETDLVQDRGFTAVWDYEADLVTYSTNQPIRLPRAGDLLPTELGRRLLTDVDPGDVTPIDPTRVAGIEADGLRLDPAERQATISHADVWVDPASGLPLRVLVFGSDQDEVVLATAFEDITVSMPDEAITSFRPPPSADIVSEEVVDMAALANVLTPLRAPDRLAGLPRRNISAEGPQAVGDYGTGATRLLAIPLWPDAAEPLRRELSRAGDAVLDAAGSAVFVDPFGLRLGHEKVNGISWLVFGTVTPETLRRAAESLGD